MQIEEFRSLSYNHNEGTVQDIPEMGREIKEFLSEEGIGNFVFLQTCNRAEAYFFSHGSSTDISEQISVGRGKGAAEHLLEVVSGIDSLVVGENEILHQVREAYKKSIEQNKISPELKKVFDWALRFGKKTRRETDISSGKTSVVSIGLEYVEEILDKVENKEALVLGAGKIGKKAASYLEDLGVRGTLVANRTYENAQELAREIGGESYKLDKTPELIKKVKIAICATGAPHYILTPEKIPDLKERKIILDLSVPRNVSPEVVERDKIEYISYEELTGKARENLINRSEEVKKVENMIEEEIESLLEEDSFEDLYKTVENIRKEQTAKAKKELDKRNEDDVLKDFGRSLSEKILSVVKRKVEKNEKV